MQLTMREQEKMMISLAAMIAQRRKDKGIKLNHPEAVALITDYVLEGAREGKTVAQLMDEARNLLTREDVMEGIPDKSNVVMNIFTGGLGLILNIIVIA